MSTKANTIIKQKSRAKQRAQLGDEEYKRIEAEKRKERRLKVKKQQTLNLATPSTKKTYTMYNKPTTTTVYTIDYIYKLKTDQAVAKGKTIKRATVEEQYNNIDKLHKLIFSNDMENLDFLKDTDSVLKFIDTNDKWAVSSKNKQIQSISSILSVLSEYKTEYKIYSDLSTKNAKKYLADGGDLINIEHFVEWDNVKDLYKKVENPFDKALISIYTLQPPRRLKDIQLLTIIHNTTGLNPELNYILLNSDNKPIKFIYNNYKTASVYGIQTFDIPAILAKILQEYIAEYQLVDGSPLFANNKKKYYTNFSEIITKTFKKYIDKPVSANILRHSYIINFLLVKRSINERKKISDMMAHSVSTQSLYDRL